MASLRSGVGKVGLIVGLAVLVVVIGVIAYFVSDVFRTKANSAFDQFAHWTPENIAKNPTEYLNFCEEQTKAAVEKLKASEISITQKMSKLQDMQADAKEKVATGGKALDELKDAYKKGDAANTWPVAWRGTQLDKDAGKRQIMKLAGEIKSKTDLLTKLDAAVTQLRAQQSKVQDARDKAKDQLAKIDTDREMLKVQQITDDLKNNLVAMKGAIETSVVGVASTEAGSLSLDDLSRQSAGTVDDAEFNKIMGK